MTAALVPEGAVLTRPQLLARGVTADALRWAVGRGRWTRLRRGVVLTACWTDLDAVAQHRALAHAALLVLAPGAVLGLRTAAMLHGLPVRPVPARVEVVVPRSRRSSAPGIDLRTSREPSVPSTRIGGLPVTPLLRTLADIARTCEPPEALVTLDAALAMGVDRADVLADVRGRRRWAGAAQAERILAAADACSPDPTASWCRGLLLEQGLPQPDVGVVVHAADGAAWGRWPMVWPERRVMVSLDPVGDDALTVLRRVREQREKDDAVRRAGWCVVALSDEEVTRHPASAAARIRAAFAAVRAA